MESRGEFLEARVQRRKLTRFIDCVTRLVNCSAFERRNCALHTSIGFPGAHPTFEALPLRRLTMRGSCVAGRLP
jgi:hypothetical protein